MASARKSSGGDDTPGTTGGGTPVPGIPSPPATPGMAAGAGAFLEKLRGAFRTTGAGGTARIARALVVAGLLVFMFASYAMKMPSHKETALQADILELDRQLGAPDPGVDLVEPGAPPTVPEGLEGENRKEAEASYKSRKEDYESWTKDHKEDSKKAILDAYQKQLDRWEWIQKNRNDLRSDRAKLDRDLLELQAGRDWMPFKYRVRFLGALAMLAGLGLLLFCGSDLERVVALFVLGFLFPQLI